MDGQLRATHVILRNKLISSSFQSPKNIIKVKDPQLKQINIAVPGFLNSPPPKSTHQVKLPTQCATKEEATSSNLAQKEEAVKEIEVVDFEEDFEIFNRPHLTKPLGTPFRHLPSNQVSNNQELACVAKAMVLQCKNNTCLLTCWWVHT